MLVKFTIDNYRSFGASMSLELMASNGIKDSVEGGYTDTANGKILNAISFYGANSSGKTNFLRALGLMRNIVLHSVRLNDNEPLPYEPFLLSTREQRPTTMEVVFYELSDRAQFTYGFSYNQSVIVKEWLQAKYPKKSAKTLFIRDNNTITQLDEVSFAEGKDKANIKLNNNRLFLSLVGQLGGETSNRVINWFLKSLLVLSGIDDSSYYKRTRKNVLEDKEYKEGVTSLLCKMKLGFNEFLAEKVDMSNLPLPQGLPIDLISQIRNETYIEISTKHNVYGDDGKVAAIRLLNLEEHESAGTNKIFNLAGPIYESLKNGVALLIDELDSQMHPLISWRLVELFNSTETNPNGAQLIFTTHDTHLLSNTLFRRDQIWFVEKNGQESSEIYQMLQATKYLNHSPRNDSNYQKNYISGKYGAIPYLTNEPLTEDF